MEHWPLLVREEDLVGERVHSVGLRVAALRLERATEPSVGVVLEWTVPTARHLTAYQYHAWEREQG